MSNVGKLSLNSFKWVINKPNLMKKDADLTYFPKKYRKFTMV